MYHQWRVYPLVIHMFSVFAARLSTAKAGSKALASRGLDAHPDLDTLLKRLGVATTLALTVDSTE